MKSYHLELHLPDTRATDLAAAGERARTAAEQLASEGIEVRWVRSVYAPERGSGVLVFEARSREDVDRAGRRAGLQYERIAEANPQTRQGGTS